MKNVQFKSDYIENKFLFEAMQHLNQFGYVAVDEKLVSPSLDVVVTLSSEDHIVITPKTAINPTNILIQNIGEMVGGDGASKLMYSELIPGGIKFALDKACNKVYLTYELMFFSPDL